MELAVKKLNTIRFFWRALNDLIGGRGMRNEIPLPVKVEEFKLVRHILEDKKNNKFQYGIYKNSDGKEYIAKQLSLKDPGIDEYWLRNEISVYSTLTKMYEQKGHLVLKKFPKIHIPKLVAVIDDKTRLLFIVEKISGQTLFDIPARKKIEILEEAVAYFKFINSVYDFRNDIITKRSSTHMLAMLPLTVIGALKSYPGEWKNIARGLREIFTNLAFIINQKEAALIHRDIGYSNILIDDAGTKYLIDFELSSYMHPMWEIAQLVVGCEDKDNFYENFLKSKTMQEILKNSKLKKTYKLFSIYCGIHLLSTSPMGIDPKKHLNNALNI